MRPYNTLSAVEALGLPTIPHALHYWARCRPRSIAYSFIDERCEERESLCFEELDRRARALAGLLTARGKRGDRAMLLFEPGLEFLVAFFGCLYAGVVAVPMLAPRRNKLRHSTVSIYRSCAAAFALTVRRLRDSVREGFAAVPDTAGLQWIALDEDFMAGATGADDPPAACGEDLAFLQYTSGSTSEPKGVMIRHRHLMANLAMIVRAMGTGQHSNFVSWVPLYHDMGLILNALQTMYLGSRCVLMAPVAFLQRPLAWLHAIQKYEAEVAGAPNFGYDLCADRLDPGSLKGLDLSGWKLAFNAAEPLRAATLRRFAQAYRAYGFQEAAFYPCYGMAEATVFMSGGERSRGFRVQAVDRAALRQHRVVRAATPDGQEIVSCGYPTLGEELITVDTDRCAACGPGEVGEVWASGPHIAAGYWQNTQASAATFGARLIDGRGPFLRTGDLGYIDKGEFYFTGRLKDTIILRGANYYPQDIELAAERSHSALRPTCGAAFTVPHGESEALVVVHEIERTHRHKLDVAEIVASIRQAVVSEFELSVHRVLLVRTGTIPKTSSGKIQRALTRARYLAGNLEVWGENDPATPVRGPGAADEEATLSSPNA